MKQGSNRSCFVLQLDLGMLHVFIFTSSLLDVFLSLTRFSLCLQSTSFESSLFFSPFYELQIESIPKHPPARLFGRSRACVLCCFQFVFDKIAFELAPGFDLAPFRKNVVHSSPRPRCLGYSTNTKFPLHK